MTTAAVLAGSFLALCLVVYLLLVRFGRAVGKAAWEAARAENAEAYIKTRKEIDSAEIVGDDPAAARRWLRDRAAAERGDL